MADSKTEYIIVGDLPDAKELLIYTIMGGRDFAEEVLNRMMNNPTKQDLEERAKFTNIKIKEVKSADCWWNDPFLAN